MEETLDELRQRRDLLAEIKALGEHAPSEDEMEALAAYVGNLQAAKELDEYFPNETEREALAEHVDNLKAAEEAA
jgi:hypothetical protein